MFRQALVSLTLWYLALIVLLSGLFSVALYRVSTSELTALQRREEGLAQGRAVYLFPPGFADFNQQRIRQIEDSKNHITTNLLYFNLIILGVGGAVSYFLAKRTLQPIESALEAQNRFTADASHELRTPLTAIKTEIEVALRDRGLNLEQSKQLHRSNLEEVGKLELLSNSLLALATQEIPRQAATACSLQEIADRAVEKVAYQAKGREIRIVTSVEQGQIVADCWAVAEVASIFLDNAIKYSLPGSEVGFSATMVTGQAVFTVIDSGRGIPAVDLPHIFDRFYRVDSSRSKEEVLGYGLGLSIAKKIIESHKGAVEVESLPERGSTFRVYFPNGLAHSQAYPQSKIAGSPEDPMAE